MNDVTLKTASAANTAWGLDFLAGGGEMGAKMRAYDWAGSPLGPAHLWPQSLKTAIRILLSSRYAMWMAWGPGLTFFCNDAYLPTLGVKAKWALGSSARKVWSEVWEFAGPRIEQVLTTGTATWDENLLLYLERSGFPEETYHTFSYSPLPDDAGNIVGMLCVVTETTARVIAERRMTLLRDLATELTLTRRLEDVGPALNRILGNQPDLPFVSMYLFDTPGEHHAIRLCFIGTTADDALFPRFIQLDAQAPLPVEGMLAGNRDIAMADLATRLGGTPGPAGAAGDQARLVPLMQGPDRCIGFAVVGLAPYRRSDPDYIGFIDLLARQIEANLASVSAYEEERRRAEALAELDRVKTAFFSNVSHEFRTPLTLMLGPLEELIEKRPPDIRPENLALAETAQRNGLRLLKLVNSLLDFSRLEAGRAQAQFRPTDLSAYTAELAASFESLLDRAGLVYRIDCPPLPQPVHVDHDMWEKIVLNLLSNAFKFTMVGEVAVALRPSADGQQVQLIVSDTGTGISPEDQARLFQRFYRVAGAQGRSFEGSGIGLALVQELVRQHGGDITVDSEPGKGSRFIVTLPVGTAHLPDGQILNDTAATQSSQADSFVSEAMTWLEDGATETRNQPDQTGAPDYGSRTAAQAGRRVLLADDNRDMREYIHRLLLAEGYVVEAVENGVEALEAIRRNPADLILSDIMMPQLDGYGLLRAIRTDPLLRHTPVIFLSARAGDESRLDGIDAGADDYLVKPFSARELVVRVARNLEITRLHRETEQALVEEATTLEILSRVGAMVTAQLDLDSVVQAVTDAATRLTGAAFGSFFYNVENEAGESYMLYALSGVSRDAFAKFPMPRNTAVFAPTFQGEGIVRSDDITRDPRYGHNEPHHGMPDGHLPVRSYLASSVVSRSGDVLGGLFFGHPNAGVFDERSERLLEGIAAQASIAIDNARLYKAAQAEIAERRKTETALRESEARFRNMADNAPVIIWITEANGNCTYINPRWTELTGLTAQQTLGFGGLEAIHPEDRQRCRDMFLAAHASHDAFRMEYQLRGAGGQYHWVMSAALPRFDGETFLGFIGSVVDLTDRKRLEEQQELLLAIARDVNATLEKKVDERTRELTATNARLRNEISERARAEEALGHAQKMEAIGQLTGGVAHDFNNLLTVIVGNIETLQRQIRRETPDRARMLRAIDNAAKGAERGAALTQRLLSFSRRAPLEPQPVDVNTLVAGMSDLMRRSLGEQVTIATELEAGLWTVNADPNQLENVLLNLAVNGRDAMPEGGTLTILTRNVSFAESSHDLAGDHVLISVRDTGTGMPQEVMEQAFEPFFTTKDIGHGTGLGLSQAYGFVKQSGGHVKLDSVLQQGTTVSIYLPRLAQADAPGTDAPATRTRPQDSGHIPRGNETILVVEDDPDVRRHSCDILNDLGYRVLQAETGAAALAMLERHPEIALLFTDIGLPGGMNGRQLSEAARRRWPALKVLFTSGYAQHAVVHDGRLDPGVQLLSKPFTYLALARKCRAVLDSIGSARVGPDVGATAKPAAAAGSRRLLLVEDDPLMVSVLAEGLDDAGYTHVETATSGNAALTAMQENPDIAIVVMDMGLPDMRGDQLLLALRTARPELPVVIASGYGRTMLEKRMAGIPNLNFIDKPFLAAELAELLTRIGFGPD
ncbi:response regulator [Ferrovibrio terrae]|uniref:response regulator n=1 Tax=Ferrovibrio terrae TaxID=2594003 RepID=UPI00163D508F|nr:response regulator [Ferrovibrio terrae]